MSPSVTTTIRMGLSPPPPDVCSCCSHTLGCRVTLAGAAGAGAGAGFSTGATARGGAAGDGGGKCAASPGIAADEVPRLDGAGGGGGFWKEPRVGTGARGRPGVLPEDSTGCGGTPGRGCGMGVATGGVGRLVPGAGVPVMDARD